MAFSIAMKTVAKINPEQEYENAKKLIEMASKQQLDSSNTNSLDSSVDNLITAARVLMEREERRRGHKRPPKESKPPKGRKKGDQRKETKKLPSERFPGLEVEETTITPENMPKCSCCGEDMKESGWNIQMTYVCLLAQRVNLDHDWFMIG